MRVNPRQYREQLYRLRSHPPDHAFYDRRDSFTWVYLSAIPFGVLEYFAEASFEKVPGGLVFPLGFLLFWAFYYTYYKPGILEGRLGASSRSELDLTLLPQLLVGVLIWFVKVTLVELGHLTLLRWWVRKPAPKAQRAAHAKPAAARPAPAKSPPPLLSADLIEALQTLGLKPGCRWTDIHRQYRALAKQFHPDLNPEITDFGRRFIHLDGAYQKLAKVRSKHFSE